MLTRGRVSHTYTAGQPHRTGADGHVIVHANPRHGTTPVSRPLAAWSAGGAPYYNSG